MRIKNRREKKEGKDGEINK